MARILHNVPQANPVSTAHRSARDERMKTLIRVVEVWVPDADGYLLELADGLYGNAVDFGRFSRDMCFGKGEGLPGRVWEEARPIILKDLQGSYFRRRLAAKAAGLGSGVALPVYAGDTLKAVLVFFTDGGSADAGAIELWHNDPRVTTDLTLVDGYYGSASQDFAKASRDAYLNRGAGLPGLAWQRGGAVFMDGLAGNPKFLRAAEAGPAGISHGVALPCPVPGNDTYVLTFLSAFTTPIASRVESWVADGATHWPKRSFGHCESAGPLPAGQPATPGFEQEAVSAVFRSGVPAIRKGSAMSAGGLVALPVYSEGAVSEVTVLHF
jgi:hypothetical protein